MKTAEGMPRAPHAPSERQNCSAILCEVLRHPRDHTEQGQGHLGQWGLRAGAEPSHPHPPQGWCPFKRNEELLSLLAVHPRDSKLHPCNNKV